MKSVVKELIQFIVVASLLVGNILSVNSVKTEVIHLRSTLNARVDLLYTTLLENTTQLNALLTAEKLLETPSESSD